MAEYIEREALMRNLKQFAPEQLTPLIESLIQKQPAEDVVEVVRCKDCKNYDDKFGIDTLYVVEDITGTHTDPYHYKLYFHTDVLPSVEVKP